MNADLMHLTDHEVSIITSLLSSAVAVTAIIWGYRGVRSANRNALEIAREERSVSREDDLTAVKRLAYAKLIAELSTLIPLAHEQKLAQTHSDLSLESARKLEGKYSEAHQRTILSLAEVEIVAPRNLNRLALNAYVAITGFPTNHGELKADQVGAFWIAQLRRAIRIDLRGYPVPAVDELNGPTVFPGED
jgi:hypothetical protein